MGTRFTNKLILALKERKNITTKISEVKAKKADS